MNGGHAGESCEGLAGLRGGAGGFGDVWAPRGQKVIILLDEYVGASDRWIDQWQIPADNTAFLFVVLAGQVLSPHWFTWTRQALEHYYFDPFSYDPQMMGISPQNVHCCGPIAVESGMRIRLLVIASPSY